MKFKLKPFLIIFLIGIGISYAQKHPSVQLRVKVSPQEITIGDPINVEMTVLALENIKVKPLALEKSLQKFEVLNYELSKPKPITEEKFSQTHYLTLTTFSTGSATIPSLTLLFETSNKEEAQAQTQPVEIKIISILEQVGDEGGLRPLKGFFNFTSYLWLWVALGVIALLVLILMIVNKINSRSTLQKESQSLPPEVTIWDLIQRLEDSDYLDNNKIKEFYSELTNGFKQYLEGRYNFSALDQTTTEILFALRQLNLDTELQSLLRHFLDNSDLVKFAKLTPERREIEADLERVKKIVISTTPVKVDKNKEETIPV